MRPSATDNTMSYDRDRTSSEVETVVRRIPRVGAQFQTRISKATGVSLRPTPERMSSDFPYKSDMETRQQSGIRVNVPMGSKFGVVGTPSCFDTSLPGSKSNRGGLLMHKPAQEKREFSIYTHPFMVSSRSRMRPKISNEAWIQHMIHLHSTKMTGKRNRACRGNKRKRAENEELIWSLENIIDRLHKSKSGIMGAEIMGEEEATALEHLCLYYDGNIDAAEFNLLVKLSGGQATKMRIRDEKERTKQKLNCSSQQTSESWRDMYQSSTFPYVRTVLGQLQDDTKPLYQKATMVSRTHDGMLGGHNGVKLPLEPEDSKGAWRSILTCGKAIERQLNSENSELTQKKPLLSTLLTFVNKAYALPTPESCFGAHHIIIEEISNTFISILRHIKRAQHVLAKIRDKIFNDSKVGIDSDDLFKFLDTECNVLPIRLREVDKLNQFRDTIIQWESRLVEVLSTTEENCICANTKNYLYIAEKMQQEARGHGYRSKALVQLSSRIMKAYGLRDRILRWKYACNQGKLTTIKTVSGFLREAKRIKLFFPELLVVFKCNRLAEEWIDRANIAIRSKISLDEIKRLIERREEISLDLSEYTDKLNTRVRIADDWLQEFDEIVPFLHNGSDRSQFWKSLQMCLQNGNYSILHELSSEGNRIPVDIVSVKLLQLAIDAKNWSTKALKWTPNNSDSKRGKLGDLREHLCKISSLREKLPLPENERKRWKPAGEVELTRIIVNADSWIAKYNIFLVGDNRRSDRRCCLSIRKLRTIVEEGNSIYANIGNSISKISRILAQAENWYHLHLPLLQHCGLSMERYIDTVSPRSFISVNEMSAAVEGARVDIAFDLDEAMGLRKLLEKCNSWNERVTLIAPRRNKRHVRGFRSKFRLKDLIDLVEEATDLPIDTNGSVNRLQVQLNTIEMWRSEASKKLEDVLIRFQNLKAHVDDVYGAAKDYNIDRISEPTENSGKDQRMKSLNASSETNFEDSNGNTEYIGKRNDSALVDSIVRSQEDNVVMNRGSNSALDVFRLVRELKEESKDISVITIEGEVGEILDIVSKWCVKSFKHLNNPREVFDKRYFGAFDRFIVEGEDLFKISCNSKQYANSSDGINKRLFRAWGSFVNDQLTRLTILKREREKFELWCERASHLLSNERSLTAEKLADLSKNSRHFPANRDLVSKVRGLSVKVSKWTATTKNLLESGEKIDVQDARSLVEKGEQLKVQTKELKKLKGEVQAARNWSIRAKKCSVEQGTIHLNEAKELIEEHHNLLIEMPDDLEILKQATIGYCICRRPYDGFMIGCDHCDEWYHGSCIGISELKAERVEKFTCIRCSTRNILKSSATTAVGIIRKWTCPKELKKSRQVEYQKLQRKFRKEKRDIEKFSGHIKQLENQLAGLNSKEKREKEDNATLDSEISAPGDFVFNSEFIGKKLEKQTTQCDNQSDVIVIVGNEESINPTNNLGVLVFKETSLAKNPTHTLTSSDAQQTMNITESTKVNFSASDSDVTTIPASGKSGAMFTKAEILSELDKAKASLQLSNKRLKKISDQSQEISLNESEEDKNSIVLRNWCLKVRSKVLAPSVESCSEINRPSSSGIMSYSMQQIIAEAKQLGILILPDVEKMITCFKGMCWSFSAMGVLRHKPSISEVRRLVSEALKFKLPDEKALRTMKYMTNKATQLQSKVKKVLSAKKGELKPVDVSTLKEILSGIRELPLLVPEERILHAVIEDNGTRHCICGGPVDGNQMFSCNSCDKKFHAACIEKADSNGASEFICPEKECNVSRPKLVLEEPYIDLECHKYHSLDPKHDVSPHAPNPIELWPPFGPLQSQAAIEVFGYQFLVLNDVQAKGNNGGGEEYPKVCLSHAPTEARVQDEKFIENDNSVSIAASVKRDSSEANADNEISQRYIKSCTSENSCPELKRKVNGVQIETQEN